MELTKKTRVRSKLFSNKENKKYNYDYKYLAIPRIPHDRIKAYSIKSGVKLKRLVSDAIDLYLNEQERKEVAEPTFITKDNVSPA